MTQFAALWRWAAAAAVALHVAFILFVPVSDRVLNAWHLSLILGLGYGVIAIDGKQGRLGRILGGTCALAGLASGVYFLLFEDAVFDRFRLTLGDQFVAWAAFFLVLDLTRRIVGWVIPAIAATLVLYVLYFGRYFDGLLFFGGLTEYRMAYRLFWQDGALLGSTTTISATIIFMFVFLSVLMRAAGATEFIINGSLWLMRRVPGGSAHVAVLSSALMGTVSGSAVANVAGTGAITIPMMKRAGLKPEVAGGVEAAASTGAQLVPPVMGAGVFIMSDWTGMPYSELITLAILPAVLFFLSISLTIHLELKRDGLLNAAAQAAEDLPRIRIVDGLPFVAPIGLLIGLLIAGYSPVYAAGFAAAAVVAASFFGPRPLTPDRWLDICAETIRTILPTAIVLICSGVIVVCVETSGLVVALAQSLSALGGGNILLVLALIALISMFLGMGLPVTASYIVVASFAAPALTHLGVNPVAAHMSIFWLSQDSLLTPPVCLAAYAAASISGGNPARTGVRAMLLGKGLYIMPVLFTFHGLLFEAGPLQGMIAAAAGGCAILFIACATAGCAFSPLAVPERFLAAGAGIALLVTPDWVQVCGLLLGGTLLARTLIAGRSSEATTTKGTGI